VLCEVIADAGGGRVALGAVERTGEEFHDRRVGVHGGERGEILVAPSAE
jgi:hypothetical protein